MAEASQKSDNSESMEEILQSIKRIMEDEKPDEANAEDEVFDLTQAIKEDGTIIEIVPSQDSIDEMFASVAPVIPKPEPEPVVKNIPKIPEPAKLLEDGLMSSLAADAAANAFKQIIDNSHKDYAVPHIASPEFRNGNTVEDLVLEGLRPMLKDWLDEHLPVIVQKIVEKEVKRIVSKHYDL